MTHDCPVCSYTTNRKYNLKRHCILMHGTCEFMPCANVQSSAVNVQSSAVNVQSSAVNVQSSAVNVQSLEGVTGNGRDNTENLAENVSCHHKCPTCYMDFRRNKDLRAHIPRCKHISNPLECEKCHRILQTRSALSMHRHRCDGVSDPAVETANSQTYIGQQTVIQNQNNTVNNTINVAGDLNNNTLIINNFGSENKDYIAIEFIRQCLNQGHHGISPMIDKIYFDPEHPENHNVGLESFKNKLVKVVQDNKWQFASLLNTIDTMISKASTFILTSLQKEIVDNIQIEARAAETMANVQSIQSLEPQVKKRLREHTKGRLARRRDNQE